MFGFGYGLLEGDTGAVMVVAVVTGLLMIVVDQDFREVLTCRGEMASVISEILWIIVTTLEPCISISIA